MVHVIRRFENSKIREIGSKMCIFYNKKRYFVLIGDNNVRNENIYCAMPGCSVDDHVRFKFRNYLL